MRAGTGRRIRFRGQVLCGRPWTGLDSAARKKVTGPATGARHQRGAGAIPQFPGKWQSVHSKEFGHCEEIKGREMEKKKRKENNNYDLETQKMPQ